MRKLLGNHWRLVEIRGESGHCELLSNYSFWDRSVTLATQGAIIPLQVLTPQQAPESCSQQNRKCSGWGRNATSGRGQICLFKKNTSEWQGLEVPVHAHAFAAFEHPGSGCSSGPTPQKRMFLMQSKIPHRKLQAHKTMFSGR